MESFIEAIKTNLERSGFPNKKVSFPVEKMYEVADNKGLSFNKALEHLKEDGIESEITTDKVIFSKQASASPFDLPTDLEGLSKDELKQKASEMMGNMSTDQMSEMKKMFESMSPKEREDLMKKAKDMNLI